MEAAKPYESFVWKGEKFQAGGSNLAVTGFSFSLFRCLDDHQAAIYHDQLVSSSILR